MITLTALLITLMTGCDKSLENSVFEEQENRYFDLYIAANYSDINPIEEGLYYIDYKEGTGASPDTGDYVLINFLTYTIPDENVVDTYKEDWALEHNIYNSQVLYGPYKFKHGAELQGLRKM